MDFFLGFLFGFAACAVASAHRAAGIRSGKHKPKFDGFFRDWKLDGYYIQKTPYLLRVGEGYVGFRDGSCQFLSGFSRWERWLLWREFRREVRRRAMADYEQTTKTKETNAGQ